jgi:DNA-directed RNA polymerase subunit K/omega
MSKTKKIDTETEDDYDEEINIIEEEDSLEDFDDTDVNEFDDNEDMENMEENDENGCILDKIIEDDNTYFDNLINSEIKPDIEEILLEKENRISTNRLTKYEMTRILGERTGQLKKGAKPMVKNFEHLSYEKIAEKEFELDMIPYKIKRKLPNGKSEIWQFSELKKDHLFYLLEE